MKISGLILTLLLSFMTCTLTLQINSQSSYTDFLPLQAGNVWVYQCRTNGLSCGFCSGMLRIYISGDTVVNGKTYYKTQSTGMITTGSCPNCGLNLPLANLRVDPQNGNVYQFTSSGCQYSPGEMMIDSFKARLHDSVRMNCQPPGQWSAYICTDTNNSNVFTTNRQSRIYTYSGFEGGHSRKYAKGIGLYYSSRSGLEGGTYNCIREMILLGCVINGVVYGDTSMLVGIQQISTEVPNDFSLQQNYPNPFNPVTKISFSLPVREFVSITVFDVTGSEVEMILSEPMSPGYYETEWNAVNYPSGVYYYKLSAGNFSQTKKMVLMK